MALTLPPADAWAVQGILRGASNLTLLVQCGDDRYVYKPIEGESPLWDFPIGTLASREVAAFALSEALGWALVPTTVMAEGPYGLGMVQRWVEWNSHPIDVFQPGQVPRGWLAVVNGVDERGDEVVLAHEDLAVLRRFAAFDVLANNADRKGGHLLTQTDGSVAGIDHGICFHTDPKLRTVLWGFAGGELAPELTADIEHMLTTNTHRHALAGLLSAAEIRAVGDRGDALLRAGRFPEPGARFAFPWPPI